MHDLDLLDVLTDEADAAWLGQQAARKGVVALARAMVPPQLTEAYEQGATMPDHMRVYTRGLTDNQRRQLLRALIRMADSTSSESTEVPPLPIKIQSMTQRADVGTATRYDIEICDGNRTGRLRDLRANDLLSWERLRPIAFDSRIVLPRLLKGQGHLWVCEVQRAMDCATFTVLDPEDSEAYEIRELLVELSESARLWVWSEDDPAPHGIARIEWQEMTGWPRGPIIREIRSSLGRVNRVALRRARADIGWRSYRWQIETARLRVWARPDREPGEDG